MFNLGLLGYCTGLQEEPINEDASEEGVKEQWEVEDEVMRLNAEATPP